MFPAKVCESLDTNSQVVIAWLCFFANEKGECFPSIAKLGEKTKLSKNTIKKALVNLGKKDLIEIIQRKNNKSFTSNLYKIKVGQEMTKGGSRDGVGRSTIDQGVGQEMDINQNYINQKNLTKEDNASLSSVSSKKDNIPYEKIRELYNTIVAHSASIAPSCIDVTPSRKPQVRARWKRQLKTLGAWEQYFKRVAASDFLMNAKFTDFGWLINAENCTKILEDKYSNFRNQK